MKPLPWSHSALATHDTCPEQYHHKYVLKDLPPEEKTAEQDWGTFVHKKFEDYLLSKPGTRDLPVDLKTHQPYLDGLLDKPGVLWAEQKVALRRQPFGPSSYFDRDVWWRGVIDATVVDADEAIATIADYKTGKKKDDWSQLAMSAIYTFIAHPNINLVNAQFYWTTDQTTSKKVWARTEMDSLFEMLAPKLDAYVQSFETDTWPLKQSGLCRGWCPVKTCQFWEPKKEKYR